MKRYVLAISVVASLLVGLSLVGQNAVFARSAQPYPYGEWYIIGLCSNVDYDAVAAKALNMAPADFRTALVGGQYLEDIAKSQNVPLDSVKTALLNAHFNEIDQAVSDGLLDANQAKQIKTILTNNEQLNQNPNQPYLYRAVPVYFGMLSDIYAYNFENVKVVKAAAETLDKKCPDLVKELQSNRTLVELVTAQGGQIGAVVDAMIKAYQNGLDQDVKEQLITAAQAKGLRVQLAERVTNLINQGGQPLLMQMFSLPGVGANNTLPSLPQPFAAPGAVQSQGQSKSISPVPQMSVPPMNTAPQTAPSTSGGSAIATAEATASTQ